MSPDLRQWSIMVYQFVTSRLCSKTLPAVTSETSSIPVVSRQLAALGSHRYPVPKYDKMMKQ